MSKVRLIPLIASSWISRPLRDYSSPEQIPRTGVLGYFQSSLRDYSAGGAVLTQTRNLELSYTSDRPRSLVELLFDPDHLEGDIVSVKRK
jgi:hypothetical protein